MSIFPTKVLLATDGSEDAARAALAAVGLAGRSGSELHAVYVAHRMPTFNAFLSRATADLLEAEARKRVDGWMREAGGAARVHTRAGRVADEVLAVADEIGAGLLVVGARGHSALHRAVAAGVSEGLAHRARVPVLVVRGGTAWPPERVVVGDDASEPAGDAGEVAAAIGALFGAEVTLVRAHEGLPVVAQAGRATNERLIGEVLRDAEEDLEVRADHLEDVAGRRPRTKAFAGDPAASILKAAGGDGGTLVALGSRGLGGLDRLRLGSVSDKVLRRAEGPVLVDPRAHRVEPEASTDAGAPHGAPLRPKLLLATDGSRASLRAAEHAAYLARVLGAKLHAVYVVDEDRAFRAGIHYGEAVGQLARDGREALGEVASLAEGAGVEHEGILAEGRPDRSIAGIAEELGVDYVIVGSHGENRLGRALAGSVSEGVLHRAGRPVLVVGGDANHPPSHPPSAVAGVGA